MQFFIKRGVSPVAIFWLSLLGLSTAQQLQLNYYDDHYCKNYKVSLPKQSFAQLYSSNKSCTQGSLTHYWAETMAGDGNNCYNYNFGNSILISECYAGSFCVCLMYFAQNCAGDYSSIQYGGYDQAKNYEYNCLFGGNTIQSLRCYYFA